MTDKQIILSLAERLWICSRLLTCAAMRLGWDEDEVRELIARLRDQVFETSPFLSGVD